MIGGVVYALVLLGCDDAAARCDRLADAHGVYADRGSCQSQEQAALTSNAAARADYPTVIARCMAIRRTATGINTTRAPRLAAATAVKETQQ